MLTGKLPFEGPAHSILYQQVFERRPSLLDRRPDTPPDLRMALDRALAKDSHARFRTMEEFATAVSGERSGPTTVVSEPVKPASPVTPVKPASDHGAGVYVALATVLLLRSRPGRAPRLYPRWRSGVAGPFRARAASRRSPAVEAGRRIPADAAHRRLHRCRQKRRGPARTKLVQYALLKVDSDPRGVLYVDGVRVGLTPITTTGFQPVPTGSGWSRRAIGPSAETIVVKGTVGQPPVRDPAARRR